MIADNIPIVSDRTPLIAGMKGPKNYLDIPDPTWDDYLMDRKVARGAQAFRIYWSKITGSWHRCMVYTPPECNTSPEKKYPVLYLHHPAFKNTDTAWMFQGKAPLIMDNLLEEGKAVPFIIVTNECGPQLPEDCIPFIEKEYRCLDDKWNRATAGASWGGMLSSQLAFTWPDKFANVGMISSGLRCVDSWPELKDNHYLDWIEEMQKRLENNIN